MFVILTAGTSCQARLGRISCLCPTPPHPKPVPTSLSLLLYLCAALCQSRIQSWSGTSLQSIYLVLFLSTSFPFFSTQLHILACSSFWHEALNISSDPLDSPLPIQLFLLNPSFVSQTQLVFLKHIYTKNRSVALCAEAFSLQISYKVTKSYFGVFKGFSAMDTEKHTHSQVM